MVATRKDLEAATPGAPTPPTPAKKPATHRWRFFRAGGVDQVQLRDGKDIVNLAQLDQKLWVALAMPIRGVELDARTLEILDSDKDGRIRAPEILAACAWVAETWRDPDDLLDGDDSIFIASIKSEDVAAAARRTLETIGKRDAIEISVADAEEAIKRFSALRLNGDGIVPSDCTDDFEARRAIDDIVSTLGGLTDRSRKPGVDKAKTEAFFAACEAFAAWHDRADETILPAGPDGTPAAAAAIDAVRAKLDDYFVRCRLVAFDPRAAVAIGGAEADLLALGSRELSVRAPEVTRLPVARIEPGKALPLRDGLNPAWVDAITTFADKAMTPLLGSAKKTLSEDDWGTITGKIAPYLAWMAEKPTSPVVALGIGRVRELLAGGAKEKILALIAADQAKDEDHARLAVVEKLVHFQRDLFKVLNNFVNFSEFYGRKGAVFQAGTLYLDGRSCELTFHVADAAKHGALAGLSAAYLAYVDCTRGGEKMTICAAFTGGDSDNLMVGRNGVFYDRRGRDWDATITKIVSNPISLREAFFAPYKKFARMIEDQFAKRAATADEAATAKLQSAAIATANADKLADKAAPAPPAATAAPPPAKKIDVGTVAAIGVAIGGIGAMIAGVLSAFFGLGMWMPIGILALILMISGPSIALAYLKLRQRNLGPILDANGWAINGRARINVPFGGALTDLATLPANAERSLVDPYAEKRRPWKRWIALFVIVVLGVSWAFGRLDKFLPKPMKSKEVLGSWAPGEAETPAPPTPAPAPAAPEPPR